MITVLKAELAKSYKHQPATARLFVFFCDSKALQTLSKKYYEKLDKRTENAVKPINTLLRQFVKTTTKNGRDNGNGT